MINISTLMITAIVSPAIHHNPGPFEANAPSAVCVTQKEDPLHRILST
jgi:hypothetical protein